MKLRQALVLALALVVAFVGCGSAPATAPAPVTSPVPKAHSSPPLSSASISPGTSAGDPWLVAAVPIASAVTTAPSQPPGYFCDPCHGFAENQLFGVGEVPAGLVAVGVEQPPAYAIAFSSPDGRSWVPIAGFRGAEGTTALAVASNGQRTVIVGLDPSGATAWASGSAGGTWQQAPRQADLQVPYAAGAMTSVTSFDGGFVAGGYRDDPLHVKAAAAVWRSNDGLAWHLDSGAGAFSGGRIWGIAATVDTIVAVGTNGDPNYGPAAVWRWTSASGWQRARVGPDDSGAMRAVAVTPSGFVAVGLNGHDDGAQVWTSTNGLTWTAVPDQQSFHYYSLPLRMQAVVAGPSGLTAGGWRSDAGKGSAVTWTSTDGVTWQGPVWEPSFSGGQVTGLAVSASATVAVGRTGYPDWNEASIWLSRIP